MPSLKLVIALYEFVILLFSVSVHECAQGWMSSRLGDQTARLEGRISLNPTRHIDVLGTLVYPALMVFGPLIGFGGGGIVLGWGKPTPIITRNLRKITRDTNFIVLAGLAANLLLAFVAFLLLILLVKVMPGAREALIGTLQGGIIMAQTSAPQALVILGWLMIQVNLGLFFFNLLPIPPLDGSRFLRNVLPYNALNTFDNIARFAFIVIFIVGRIWVSLFLGPAMGVVVAALALFL